MPLPLLFIGAAAITGAVGGGKTIKAGIDQSKAKALNSEAGAKVEVAAKRLDVLRKQCGDSLESLGEEKIYVLNNNVADFLRSFEKIKNVDFRESVGLIELNKMKIDKKEFEELGELTNFAKSLGQGGIAGVAGGAATAIGAYSLAGSFAAASTGTAISTLSGAAATNATLAFFGGGSLAAGGLGVAGGTAVLGGLVAGPALLVMGLITGAKAGKALETARSNMAEANEAVAQLSAGADQCIAIRRRCYMFYSLLARLDARMVTLVDRMEKIIESEGTDYSLYQADSKKAIASAASIAVTIKTIIDTPILTEDGSVTTESRQLIGDVSSKL